MGPVPRPAVAGPLFGAVEWYVPIGVAGRLEAPW